jgi:hypothetical protein
MTTGGKPKLLGISKRGNRYLHGPTEIATRGRSKSPAEADRNRHLRPEQIAT